MRQLPYILAALTALATAALADGLSAPGGTTSASDLSSGTLGASRLSGAYTGITGIGTLTSLATSGAISASNSGTTEHVFANTADGSTVAKENVASFRNLSSAHPSAIRFLDSAGNERGATGFGNDTGGASAFWYRRTFFENSNLNSSGTGADKAMPFHFVNTGLYSGAHHRFDVWQVGGDGEFSLVQKSFDSLTPPKALYHDGAGHVTVGDQTASFTPTDYGTAVLRVYAAEDFGGTRETLASFTKAGSASSLSVVNTTGASGGFAPFFYGDSHDSNNGRIPLGFIANTDTDTGTAPIIQFDTYKGGPINGSAIATRPVYRFANGNAALLDISAGGNATLAGSPAVLSATAIPAGGTAGGGYKFSSTANFGIFFGSGAPTLSAAKGSLYLRSDGSGTSDRAYVNTNGGTNWAALTTAS